jgi:hypothetical protein
MLRTGVEGWTENDILRYCRLSSGRNYASELERQLDIQLERIDEKTRMVSAHTCATAFPAVAMFSR